MTALAYIYDPTASDDQSRVRGIGRYYGTLREIFDIRPLATQGAPTPEASTHGTPILTSVTNVKSVPKNGVFINPFFNLHTKPLKIRRIARKQVAVIHDLIPLKYKNYFPIGFWGHIYSILNKWSLRNYDLIITDSAESKKDIIFFLKIPEKKIKIIYPTTPHIFLPHLDTSDESVEHHHPFHGEKGSEVAEFNSLPPEKTISNKTILTLPPYMLYVGDATWNKNLPTLAHAIELANIPCVFVGKVFTQPHDIHKKPHPWLQSLYTFLKNTQNNKLFIFPGYVSDFELLYLYKNARINILPSIDEGFGYSFVEAGYMSTPSVLADRPIFHEIARDAALFAPYNDPKTMAQKLAGLFYDNTLHEKMSIKAFDRAQEFAPDKFKLGWFEALESLTHQ